MQKNKRNTTLHVYTSKCTRLYSVVGPSLFLAYINDLPGSVGSRVRLFADDTIVYLTIKSHASAQSLQEDLHNLELWEKEWSMEFNPE